MIKSYMFVVIIVVSYSSIYAHQMLNHDAFYGDPAVQVRSDICFSRNTNYLNDSISILFDLYYSEKCNTAARPLVIFLHGGGFCAGDKKDAKVVRFCKEFASHGYVAVAIGYRTGILKRNKKCFISAILRAYEDINDAILYCRTNVLPMNINSAQIYVGGISAGAVTALHYAFWDYDEIMNYFGHQFADIYLDGISHKKIKNKQPISGVLNCSGALINLSWIENNVVPICNVHGEKDLLVPIDSGYPMHIWWLPKLYGSASIHKKHIAMNLSSEIKIYPNGRHGDPEKYPLAVETAQFMISFLDFYSGNGSFTNVNKEIEQFETHVFFHSHPIRFKIPLKVPHRV